MWLSGTGVVNYPSDGSPRVVANHLAVHAKGSGAAAHCGGYPLLTIDSKIEAIAGQAKPAADIVEGHKSAVMIHLGNISAMVNRRLEFDASTESIRNDPEAARLQGREYRAPWKLVYET